MATITLLSHEQLYHLARTIYMQEVDRIHNVRFKSESELAKYLRDCRACFETSVGVLDDGREIEPWFHDDNKDHASIAHDIYGFIVNAANHALQTVRNFALRINYVKEIRQHATSLRHELAKLKQKWETQKAENKDEPEFNSSRRLAKEASEYRSAMLEFIKKHKSRASRQFSKWIKEAAIKFEDLIRRHQAKLGFSGRHFKGLEDVQKIQVYESIIESSGRGKVRATPLSKAFGVAGIAATLFAVGMMVWDIFSAEHVFEKAIRETIATAASIGGAMLGEVVGVAMATHLCVTAAESGLFVLMVGVTFSIIGAFIVGAFAGWLVDFIIKSGGSAPFSTEGQRYYVSPLPDGFALARQITHHTQLRFIH